MPSTLMLVSVVILGSVLFNKISGKIGIPMLLAFIIMGMLFGTDGLLKIDFDNFQFAKQVCSVALISIIFYGGFGTRWSEAKKVAGKSLLLSSAGVLLTAFLTGFFCHLVLGFELLEGLLIGSVLSSTDAASVFSILRSKKLNLKYGTASILELESGSNDPWAYMLTIIILSVMNGNNSSGFIAYTIFAQIFFGILFGVTISVGAVFMLRYIKCETSGFDMLLVVAIALLSYAVPASVGGNGYLSAYIVGIVLGNVKIPNKKPLVNFFDGITGFSQILIFFLLGLLAFPSQMPKILIPSILIMLFLTFIARPLVVAALMKPFKSPLNQQAVIAWSGLRGATSIVFAIMATVGDAYTKNDVFHIVFCIVLISIAVQGSLLPIISRKLSMIDNNENVMRTFNDYSDETEIQFIRLNIREDSDWAGKKVRDLVLPHEIRIVMVIREKQKIIPVGKTDILPHDILVLSAAGFYDDSTFVLSELSISQSHEWCGRAIADISMPKDTLIVMIKRNGKTLIPSGNIKIKLNDILVITSSI